MADCICGPCALFPYAAEQQHRALAFCLALVQQGLPYGSLFASLLLSYVAGCCLMWQGVLHAPNDYSSIINRLRYGMLLTLQSASRVKWLLLRNKGLSPSTAVAVHATEALRSICQQCLCCDSMPPSVRSALNCIILYVKVVAQHALLPGQIVWDRTMELVCFRHMQLQLMQWRDYVNNLNLRCSHMLHDKLLFALLSVDSFPLARQLRKSWCGAQPDKNFCYKASNKALLAPWRNWLLAHIDTDPVTHALTKAQHTHASASQWDTYGVQHYLNHMMALLRKLLMLNHMISGLLAHWPELLGVHWCNTKLLRNIFISESFVMLLMAYNRRKWRVNARAMARFLSQAVGNLLVKVIILVLPFARNMRCTLQPAPLNSHNSVAPGANDANDKKTGVDEQGVTDADICLPLLSDTIRYSSVFGKSSHSPDANEDDNIDDYKNNADADDANADDAN